MILPNRLLSEINLLVKSNTLDIDSIKYTDHIKKYTLPSIINFDWKNILDLPPKNSSQQTSEELQYVASLTLNRSTEDLALIDIVDKDPAILVKKVCDTHNISFPTDRFDKWYDNTKNLIYTIKYYFNRPRPKQLADFYHLKMDTIDSDTAQTPSYPSGHTVYAKLAALLVESVHPELAPILHKTVVNVAYARCCQGVHFPSDNQASIILADTIYQHLKTTN